MLTSTDYNCIAPDVTLGSDVRLSKFINLYGCEIGDETRIGAFVEIQRNARVGRRCKISSHTFICEGVTIDSVPSWRQSRSSSTVASRPANDAPYRLIDNVEFGEDVVAEAFVNLYGCRIGDGTRLGTFVEVQKGAVIGRRCKISSHTFICEGVEIEDEVFVGHGVMFTNTMLPRATNAAAASCS